jgi:hypothetical protein
VEALPAIATGVVLAASAGLRAFLPVFSAGLAVRLLGLPLPGYLAWMDDTAALVLFGVATVLEVLGDKVPVVDHALDAVQSFSKPLLAALAATPFLYQLSPESGAYAVALGLILGAPLALTVHGAKATARVGSTAATGGVGNPLLSAVEDVSAVGAIVLVFLAPLLALALTAALLYVLLRLAWRVRRRRQRPPL